MLAQMKQIPRNDVPKNMANIAGQKGYIFTVSARVPTNNSEVILMPTCVQLTWNEARKGLEPVLDVFQATMPLFSVTTCRVSEKVCKDYLSICVKCV